MANKWVDKCIADLLADDHEDGRIFRDCDWNYSVLYGKVDTEILKDYESLKEYYSKW